MPILMEEAEKKTFEIDGESVIINKATGYNDGYYWDYNIKFLYKGFEYHLCEFRSFSGYYPCHSFIKRGTFGRLYGAEQTDLKNFEDHETLRERIEYMLKKLGDKEEYEESEE